MTPWILGTLGGFVIGMVCAVVGNVRRFDQPKPLDRFLAGVGASLIIAGGVLSWVH